MKKISAVLAIIEGFKLCFFNKDVRKLAIWPWLIGAITYVTVCISAIYIHGPVLEWLVGIPEGFWAHVLYYLAWAGVALFLVVATLVISFVMVMVFGGFFQSAIAEKVLREKGQLLPEDSTNVKGVLKEVSRSVATESVKLLWLVPLLIILLILGFIPVLTPVAIIAASWLLAYESIDVVLDLFKIRARKRLAFALKQCISVTLFGLTLTLCGLIPFVGLFLPPVAVAGAAWLLADEQELIKKLTG